MAKDRRYELIAPMIAAGRILRFRDLFHFTPKTIVAQDLGINNVRFTRLMGDVDDFVLKDLLRLSTLMEIDPSTMLRLVLDQYATDKINKKRNT
jgi:hypothetical protein